MIFPGKITAQGRRGLCAVARRDRRAELAALRPQDIDLDARTVRVTRQIIYKRGGHSFGPPTEVERPGSVR